MAPFKSVLLVAILTININWVFTATLTEDDLATKYPGLYSEGTCPTLQPIENFKPQNVSKVCTNVIFYHN